MQNWDTPLPPVNYEHNWYGNMFPATHIKTEPQSIPSSQSPPLSVMEHFLKQQTNPNNVDMTSSASLTPSPRQENNDNHNFFGTDNVNSIATPMSLNNPHIHPLGFNPLTPPGLPNAILPPLNFHHQQTTNDLQQNIHHDSHMQSPPPSNCNTNTESADDQNQQTADQQDNHHQQNGNNLTKLNDNNSLTPRNTPPMDITPPKSPKHYNSGSEYLEKDPDAISNSSDFVESEDDDTIRMPIYNSHGKMKNYKCKSCGFNAITKIAFWTHTRSHMKPEKIMQCPKCPFVTELKHHLEYHIRKHKNLKPFQCDKCNYSCVNKSMLNSHLKSHSSVYQYRCSDCDYATKYCHSFKLHLRKYDHKPGLVLDEEGLPNPAIIIDVYGTRRGPKTKSVNGRSSHKSSAASKMANSVHAMNQLNAQKSNLSSPLKATNVPEMRQAKSYNMMNLSHQNQSQQQQQQQQQQQRLQQPLLQPNQLQNNSSQQNYQQHHSQQQNQQQNHQQQHPPQIPSPAAQMPNFLPNPLANMLQQRNMPAFFPYWNLNLQMLAAQQQAVLAQLSPRMREAALQSLKLQQQQTNGCNNLKIESEQFNELQRKNGSQFVNDSEDLNDVAGDDEDEDIADNEEDDNDRRSESSAMDLSSQGTPTKVKRSISLNFGESVGEMLHLSGVGGDNGTDISTPITITNGNGSSSRRKGRVLKLETLLQNKESSISSNDDSLKIIPNEMDNKFKTGSDIIEESNNNTKIGNNNNNNNNNNNQMIRKSTSTPNNNVSHSNNNGNNLRISSTSSSSDDLTIVEEVQNGGEREQRLTISPPSIPTETNIVDCSSNSNSSCNNGNSNNSNCNTNNLINDNQNKNNNNNNSNNNNNYNGNNVNNNNINKFNNNNTNNNNNNNNSNNNNNNNNNNNSPLSGIFECKFCDIYFKDAVLYTIHMGYHSCDDVFKCNMCGEKCDGPVGLFVHMARNAHS